MKYKIELQIGICLQISKKGRLPWTSIDYYDTAEVFDVLNLGRFF